MRVKVCPFSSYYLHVLYSWSFLTLFYPLSLFPASNCSSRPSVLRPQTSFPSNFPAIFSFFFLSLFLTCTTVIAAWQCATDICPNYTKLSFGRERWKLLVNYQPISIIKNFEKNLDFSHENWTIIVRWIFLRNENFSLIFIFLELWSIEGTSHCQSLPLTDYTKFTWQYNTLPSSASIGESLITELRNGKSL